MPKGWMGQAGICERDYTKGQRISLRNLFSCFLSIIFPAKDQETERIATDHIYKVCQSGHDHQGGEREEINGNRVFRDTYTFCFSVSPQWLSGRKGGLLYFSYSDFWYKVSKAGWSSSIVD